MTPARFKAALVALGVGKMQFARAVGVFKTTPGKWLSGKAPIPIWAGIIIAEALRSKAFRARIFGKAATKPKARAPKTLREKDAFKRETARLAAMAKKEVAKRCGRIARK